MTTLISVAFTYVVFAIMDYSLPPNVRLVSGGLLSPMGEDPDVFYRRYRSRLRVRVLIALPLGVVAGVVPHLALPFPVQLAGVLVPVIGYGALIAVHMWLARTH